MYKVFVFCFFSFLSGGGGGGGGGLEKFDFTHFPACTRGGWRGQRLFDLNLMYLGSGLQLTLLLPTDKNHVKSTSLTYT